MTYGDTGCNENPLVSVVMCSYNQGRFIEQALTSVLDQDYERIELIVIDGGSTDGTVDILKKYDARLAYWVSEPDRGQSHALNKGFARASGQLRSFLNSDDILLPGAIHTVVQALHQTGANFIYGDHLYMDEMGRLLGWEILPAIPPHALLLYANRGFYSESCFWTADLHRETGEFDGTLQHAVDGDWFVRMTSQPMCKYAHVKIPLGCPRIHPNQKTALLSQPGDNIGKQHSLLWRKNFIARNRVPWWKLLVGAVYYGSWYRFHEAYVYRRGIRFLLHLPRWNTIHKLLGK